MHEFSTFSFASPSQTRIKLPFHGRGKSLYLVLVSDTGSHSSSFLHFSHFVLSSRQGVLVGESVGVESGLIRK